MIRSSFDVTRPVSRANRHASGRKTGNLPANYGE
jgi:hypothetical protein